MEEEYFRNQLTQNNWADGWWVAVDGAVLDEKVQLKDALAIKKQMPTSQVAIMHPKLSESGNVRWEDLDLPREKKVAPAPKKAAAPEQPKPVEAPPPDPRVAERLSGMESEMRGIKNDLSELIATLNEVRLLAAGITELKNVRNEIKDLKGMFAKVIDTNRAIRNIEEQEREVRDKKTAQPFAASAVSKPLPAPESPAASNISPFPVPSKPVLSRPDAVKSPEAKLAEIEALLPGRPATPKRRSFDSDSSPAGPMKDFVDPDDAEEDDNDSEGYAKEAEDTRPQGKSSSLPNKPGPPPRRK